MPCYKPLLGWDEKIITAFIQICKALPHIQLKLILVNDGSQMNQLDLIVAGLKSKMHFFEFVSYSENKGKGYALRQGVLKSTAEVCIYTDIDFPYTTESFLKIFYALENENCDVAAGIKNKAYYDKVPFFRKIISRLLRSLIALFLRIKITDTQCGLKGFNQKGKAIFLETKINRYLFDLEFIYLSSKNKHIILEPIQVELKDNIHFSKMPMRILLQEIFNFIKILFRRT